jgi:tetratricopeptide (TPR) repeat protein
MADKPDFIVDPSGNVRDVRSLKYSRPPGTPPPGSHPSSTTPRSYTVQPTPPAVRKSTTSPAVIIIPIGLIITILVALFRSAGQSSTNNHNISDSDASSLNSGNMYFADGEYDKALVEFNMAIFSNPEFGEAYNSRGLVYHARGEYDLAIADFTRTIELKPDWAAGYNNRGIVYSAKSEYELAIADYDKAIQLNDKFSKAYFNRGLLYIALEEYDAAIADFDKAIEFASGLSTGLANKYLSTPGPGQEMVQGMLDYMTLTNDDADVPLAYASRGLAHYYKGEFEQAAVDLQTALALGLNPDDQTWVETLLGTLP